MAQTNSTQMDELLRDQREILEKMKKSPLMAPYGNRYAMEPPDDLFRADVVAFGEMYEKERACLIALMDMQLRAASATPTAVSAVVMEATKDAGTDWDEIGDRVKRKQRRKDILEALTSWEHAFKDKKGAEQVSLKNQADRLHVVAEFALEAHKQLPGPSGKELVQWEAALEAAMPGKGSALRLREAASAIERGAATVVEQSKELVLASEFGWDALETARKKGDLSRKSLQEARESLDKAKDATKAQDSAKRARYDAPFRGRGRGRGYGGRGFGSSFENHYENNGGGMVPQQGRNGYGYGGYNNSWGQAQGGIQKQGGRGGPQFGPHC